MMQLSRTQCPNRRAANPIRRWSTMTPTLRCVPAKRPRCSQIGANGQGSTEPPKQTDTDLVLMAVALGLTTVAGAAVTFGQDQVLDLLYGTYDGGDGSGLPFTGGDVAGALLWSVALWFASPLQVLLLFLGFFERERPSDWLLQLMGRALQLRVDDIDYEAPLYLRSVALLLIVAAGVGTSALLELGLGDATWSVSSGIGMCLAAGVYELGRPERLSKDQAIELESQWQDFAKFADAQLVRKGRCHESEVFGAFRRLHAAYRRPEALPDATLRDMVRNWHPEVERTRTGYLKNLSLRPRADPFTGRMTGNVDAAPAAAAASAGAGAGASSGAQPVGPAVESGSNSCLIPTHPSQLLA